MVGELVDQILGHRAIFVLHERNRAALDELHRQPHDEDHEDLDEMFRRVLDNQSIAARDRVRMACAVGGGSWALSCCPGTPSATWRPPSSRRWSEAPRMTS